MSDLDRLLDELRQRRPSTRITTQRRLVLEALMADPARHHTCEDVAAAVAQHGVKLDQSTVYRILQWLKNAGVVSQTDLGSGSDVYALAGHPPHHHLVCLHCGAIIDVDDAIFAGLRRTLQLAYRFEPRIEHFAIFGMCQACQEHPRTEDDTFEDEMA
ncbi:MAG: transcriptional repressor [Anaerolineae bacterium]|nr:transcriptional repressor [Anaerolineae bacterium]